MSDIQNQKIKTRIVEGASLAPTSKKNSSLKRNVITSVKLSLKPSSTKKTNKE